MKENSKRIIKSVFFVVIIIGIIYLGSTVYTYYSMINTFDSISQSHIDGNVPDDKDFDSFLVRDLKKYFKVSNDGIVNYEFLRNGPTQAGTAYPKYYLWVKVTDKDNFIEGAVRVGAIDKESFNVYNFLSKDDIKKDTTVIDKVFPKSVCDKIIERMK